MYDIVLCVYERFRVDGDKNMRLLAFAFTIVFVWTGPETPKQLSEENGGGPFCQQGNYQG